MLKLKLLKNNSDMYYVDAKNEKSISSVKIFILIENLLLFFWKTSYNLIAEIECYSITNIEKNIEYIYKNVYYTQSTNLTLLINNIVYLSNNICI